MPLGQLGKGEDQRGREEKRLRSIRGDAQSSAQHPRVAGCRRDHEGGDHKGRPYADCRGAPCGRPVSTARLGDVVGAFKSLATVGYISGVKDRGWPEFCGRLWQRNYYEHVIRNEIALDRIRRYVDDNPASWECDEENPRNAMSEFTESIVEKVALDWLDAPSLVERNHGPRPESTPRRTPGASRRRRAARAARDRDGWPFRLSPAQAGGRRSRQKSLRAPETCFAAAPAR